MDLCLSPDFIACDLCSECLKHMFLYPSVVKGIVSTYLKSNGAQHLTVLACIFVICQIVNHLGILGITFDFRMTEICLLGCCRWTNSLDVCYSHLLMLFVTNCRNKIMSSAYGCLFALIELPLLYNGP